MRSKLDRDLLDQSLEKILKFAAGESIDISGKEVKGKKRKFEETIDLQVALKNYDPKKDKRFSGQFVLPTVPRPRMKVCMLANAKHMEQCKELGVEFRTLDDLKALNKNKKLIKKLAKRYDAFLASDNIVKMIPRLLGPGLNRAGKFPTMVASSEDVAPKLTDVRSTIKFQLKKVLCMSVSVGNVTMKKADIAVNVQLAANFLASLLKKNWQNIKVLYVKSTMGPAMQIYF